MTDPSGPRGVTAGMIGLGSAVGAAGVGALAYTAVFDPHQPGSPFPPCAFKFVTGLNCPGCGGLRMVHDVVHGDLAAAAVDNVFLLVGLPLLALWLLWRKRSGRPAVTPTLLWVTLALTLTWGVVRNLPGFPLVPTVALPT